MMAFYEGRVVGSQKGGSEVLSAAEHRDGEAERGRQSAAGEVAAVRSTKTKVAGKRSLERELREGGERRVEEDGEADGRGLRGVAAARSRRRSPRRCRGSRGRAPRTQPVGSSSSNSRGRREKGASSATRGRVPTTIESQQGPDRSSEPLSVITGLLRIEKTDQESGAIAVIAIKRHRAIRSATGLASKIAHGEMRRRSASMPPSAIAKPTTCRPRDRSPPRKTRDRMMTKRGRSAVVREAIGAGTPCCWP